jgi:2-polyprenyl-3-methyl-5-hydroxy-6-metoxy-1,4-benzoquinol methylase
MVCEAGGRLTAIDRSAKMIALATRRNEQHVAAGRARFATVALEQADFGDERFDTVFGVHVAALWRSQEAIAIVRAHLAPAGALYIFNQLPGRRTLADARAFAEPVAAALGAHALSVEAPRFADLEPSPVVCVIARQPSEPRGST